MKCMTRVRITAKMCSLLLLNNMLLEISGEITPETIKEWSQSKNNIQSWLKEKYVTDIIGEPFEQGEF